MECEGQNLPSKRKYSTAPWIPSSASTASSLYTSVPPAASGETTARKGKGSMAHSGTLSFTSVTVRDTCTKYQSFPKGHRRRKKSLDSCFMALRGTETHHDLSVHFLQFCWHVIQKNPESKVLLE